MSVAVAIVVIMGSLTAGLFLWRALPPDAVGRPARIRRTSPGFQGQLTEWLYWDAELQRPRPDKLGDAAAGLPGRVADRALFAVVHRHGVQSNLQPAKALADLRTKTKNPAARAFLDGKMSRAVRLHWRNQYGGPDGLYILWFYFIAVIRYGKRHLYLDTLSAVLKELRKP